MPMFVYRPDPPSEKAYIFAGSIVTAESGITYSGSVVSVDSGSIVTAGTPYIGKSSTPVSVDSGSTITVFGNRKFTSPASIDCRSTVNIRFVHMTSLRIYNESGFKADTRDLNFSGSTVTVSGDIVTNTDTGGGAAEVEYATRIDEVSSTLMYKAEATPGSADASAVWRISRISFAGDGDVTILWASGTSAFDKIWDNHLGLSYS